MKRRVVLLGIAGAFFDRRLASAQPVPVIGFLSGRSRGETGPLLNEFHRGLAEAGYVDRESVQIEYRWAEGHYDRLPALATDLVGRGVTVIATTGGNVTAVAAKAATSTIPIVFAGGGDPIKSGLVASLGRPGGNVTGVSFLIAELGAKRVELLRELVPNAASIGVLFNPNNPSSSAEVQDIQARAATLGAVLHVLTATGESDFESIFAEIASRRLGALFVANDPLMVDLRERLARMAAERRVPAIYFSREFAEAGGLMSYGASIADAYHKVGRYVGQILKGAKPADLPVLQPTRFELVINLKAAKALGLIVPLTLQAQADEVIE